MWTRSVTCLPRLPYWPYVTVSAKYKEILVATIKRSEKLENVDIPVVGQRAPRPERFRLQVDRQTKSSFSSFEEAETAGKAIKKAHPIVQVSVYDGEDFQETIIS